VILQSQATIQTTAEALEAEAVAEMKAGFETDGNRAAIHTEIRTWIREQAKAKQLNRSCMGTSDCSVFTGWKRECRIRKVLTGLARQRVAVVLQMGGVWVIEKALKRDDNAEAALATCLMRGWVEPLHENMPMADFDNLPRSHHRPSREPKRPIG